MKTFLKSIAAAVVSLGFALAGTQTAQATIISYSESTPMQYTDLHYAIEIPKFDLSLGTLTSVSIDYASQINTHFVLHQMSAQPANVSISMSDTFSLMDPNGLFGANQPMIIGSILPVSGLSIHLASGGIFDSGLLTGTITIPTTTYTDSNILNEFSTAGGGLLGISVDAEALTLFKGGGSMTSQVTTMADSALTVTYTYTASPAAMALAPEPSTIFGLLFLGVFVVGQTVVEKLNRPLFSKVSQTRE